MILLHAGVLDGYLMVWAETSNPRKDARAPARRGRKARGKVEAIPFGADQTALMDALGDTEFPDDVTDGNTGFSIAWLPTSGDAPLPSGPLIAPPSPAHRKTVLKPWSVTACFPETGTAIRLLMRCAGKQVLKPGVAIGDDLLFLVSVMRFAGSLVAREQFLPGISYENGVYVARWTPVLDASDGSRLAGLAKAMPHACRALTPDTTATRPPEAAALPTVRTLLNRFVDHMVRTSGIAGETPERDANAARRPQRFDSLHDQWVHALHDPEGILSGEEKELGDLAAQVAEWSRPLQLSSQSPYRLCFRLREPEVTAEDGDPPRFRLVEGAWRVEYLLQGVDDPSLLVPAKQAWVPRGRDSSLLRRPGFDAKEYLLRSLGQAARLCPPIDGSLRSQTPEGYDLDVAGAGEFLAEKAWTLEQLGFGVLVPAWWSRRGTKRSVRLQANVRSPAMQAASGMTFASLVEFEWQVAIGNETLSLDELRTLAEMKTSLVMVRGEWVYLNAEEIRNALRFWQEHPSGQATVRDVFRLALGQGTEDSGGLDIDVQATGWVGELLRQLDDRQPFRELDPPAGFQGELRPYQVRGYSWLDFLRQWGLGACLADDMGLGKTVQALALIQRNREQAIRQPVLLVAPTSVLGNWFKEAARFTPDLAVLVHHGLDRKRDKDEFVNEAARHAVVITSYALLQRDFETLKEIPWAGVILDEAQNIKNSETKQARAARGLSGEYRVILTGTPVENNVGDLWALMDFLNPGLLGTRADFKRRFFVPIQANRDPAATDRLRRLTRPFILRRLKTDQTIISDLPAKMEMKVFCNLTKEQASLYQAVVDTAMDALDGLEGIERRGAILAALTKLKQACNHPRQLLGDNSAIPGRSGKLARLTEMLEEVLDVGDCALVFTQFAEMGGILQTHLQETFGREILFLHGGVSKKRRDAMVERFQSEDRRSPIFVLSLKAGGTGLNLTQASHVFHFDRWWNPAVETQATDRAFRIGQTRNVQVHKFICVGTLEERIDELIESKKGLAENVIGTGESWLTELSTAELRQVLELDRRVVADE